MNTEKTAYRLTVMLCKAYQRRSRSAFPMLRDDPQFLVTRLMNLELDACTAIDRQATTRGFNSAFDSALRG